MNKIYNTRRELLRKNIRTYIRQLREKAGLEGKRKFHQRQLEHAVFTDVRQGQLHGQTVDRLAIFLRGTGCKWIEQTGGCTFCGFWNATNFGMKIPAKAYMKQLTNVIDNNHEQFNEFPIVCLYNDGSMLTPWQYPYVQRYQLVFLVLGRRWRAKFQSFRFGTILPTWKP